MVARARLHGVLIHLRTDYDMVDSICDLIQFVSATPIQQDGLRDQLATYVGGVCGSDIGETGAILRVITVQGRDLMLHAMILR